MASFDLAHKHYTHAVVSLVNPYTTSFSEVRNSSVSNIQLLKKTAAESQLPNIRHASQTIKSIKTMMSLVTEAHGPLSVCKESIETLINQNASKIMQEADSMFAIHSSEKESGSDDGWDNVGSDEEVIA